MNLLNVALGGLTGALSSANSPPAGSPVASVLLGGTGGAATSIPARDSVISDLSDSSSTVNLLAQFAGSQSGTVSSLVNLVQGVAGSQTSSTSSDSAQEPELTVPPLPPMPAPQPAPAVPTDDHGQSNIVFSDADADGALIH